MARERIGQAAWAALVGLAALIAAASCSPARRAIPPAPAPPATSPEVQPVRTFRVEDYGARADDPSVNSVPGIQQAIAAAIAAGPGSEVVLGAGRYYLKATPQQPGGNPWAVRDTTFLHVNKADGLTIRGQGTRTELLSTHPGCAIFYIGYSRRTVVGGFVVDYDPVPFTQGRVVARDPDDQTIDVRIDEGFPWLDEPGFPDDGKSIARLHDRARQRLKAHAPDHFGIAWQPVDGPTWRVRLRWGLGLEDVALGDVLVVSRSGPGAGAAIWADSCVDSLLRDVTMHAACGLGVCLTGTTRFTVRGVRICFREGSPRLQTTNADGLHGSGNPGGPTVEDCLFEGMPDDGINLNCHGSRIVAVRSPTQVLLAAGMGAAVGGRLQVFDIVGGVLRGEVGVVAVAREGERLLVSFDRPVAGLHPCSSAEKSDGDLTYNLAVAGEGYVIRRNVFRRHRRYAILLRPSHGLVENNRIEEVSGAAIVLENDAYWGEGPLGHDIVVRGNTVRDVGFARGYADDAATGAIAVRTSIAAGFAATRTRRGVVIADNRIEDALGIAIYVRGATHVQLTGNVVSARAEAPRHRESAAIVLDRVADVAVERCAVTDPRPQTTAAVALRHCTDTAADRVTITELQATLAPGALAVKTTAE